MTDVYLAQINIARFRAAADDPVNADFMAALDLVNAEAEASDGFIWRLTGDGNNATDIRLFSDPHLLLNMSVWRDLDALRAFTYHNACHAAIMKRRKDWFDTIDVHMALWWVKTNHLPTPEEGADKLEALRKNGPTSYAFTFSRPFHP